MSTRRTYLDHAATSWPKPAQAVQACVDYQTQLGVAAGRGAYRSSERADQIVGEVRSAIAGLLGEKNPTTISFTSNGTMALHLAIHGFLHELDLRNTHVVTTSTEHNSVLRSLASLEKQRGLRWTAVPCDRGGNIDIRALRDAVEPSTRLIIVNHASNVTGAVQDLVAISEISRQAGASLLVDAAQSLGLIDIDVNNPHIDMLAAPGHKGLGGMLGTGVLYVRSALSPKLRSPWIGGTGHHSDRLVDEFPWSESAESGNLNIPAIASLGEGVRWLRGNHDAEKLRLWTDRLIDAVEREKRLRWIGSKESREALSRLQRVPVISFTHVDLSCHEMAMLLDTTLGIEARSGFHCAAMIHRYLGTELGGTLRMSLGHTSTDADVDAAIEGIRLLGSC